MSKTIAAGLTVLMCLAVAVTPTAGSTQSTPRPEPGSITTPRPIQMAACRLVRKTYPCTQYQQRCRMVQKCIPWQECKLLPQGRQCYTTRKCWQVRQCNMVPVAATCWRTYRICD
ncbi:MAG: hypothetical protein KJ621_10295 [Proteobacteria bacterium]|nr:hypothetical protein [Pseudomonadota bacterium]MBU1742759.1 hypothetical protein [Pseudomonadota bacterium]